MKKLSIAVAALTAGVIGVSTNAQAYEAGDMILRVGAASANPSDSSSNIKIQGIGSLAGTGVEVGSNTQVGLTGTYMLSPNLGIELLASTPFKHDIDAKGLGGFNVKNLGSTKHLPPTLSVQYYPMGSGSAFQPYVGLGVNYTLFFSEELSSSAKNNLGASDLKLDDSVGLAGELGMDWAINDKWLLNVAVWKVKMNTTATLDTALGKAKVDVDIDPWVFMASAGYKF